MSKLIANPVTNRFIKRDFKPCAWLFSLGLACLSLVWLATSFAQESQAGRHSDPVLEHELIQGKGNLYTLLVPVGGPYRLALGVSSSLATVDSPTWKQSIKSEAPLTPLFIINAGFFDPQNSLTTSHLLKDGQVMGDPRQNPHLVENPKLVSYLPQIFDRSELRVYRCKESGIRYDVAPHSAPSPKGCSIEDAAGAGPQLLPVRTDKLEGFVDTDAQGRRVRDPIGVDARNARSVVGIAKNGDVILMMGAQTVPGQGFSLADMAALLERKGAVKAIALDGGSSSSIKYRNQVIYGRLNAKAELVKRPVKSVWMVLKASPL